MKLAALTGNDNYFEDFVPGIVMRHARGKTVEAIENVILTNLVMNTGLSALARSVFMGPGSRFASLARPGRRVVARP